MRIQWFPGHMTKALRMMEDNIKLVDIIGYVLDARAPMSSINPAFGKLTMGKPIVYIFNKSDLADKSKLDKWINYYRSQGNICVTVSATNIGEASKISKALAEVSAGLNQKYKNKGIFKPIRAMIVGVPNCGKSTIINCLSGKKVTVTGDRPGVTRGKQWVRLASGVELLDTPGTVWSKFEDDLVAERLCFIGSIKDDVVDIYELSCALLTQLIELYPQYITERYKVADLTMPIAELHTAIGAKRGFVIRGGDIDWERTSKTIIDDFRKGKLGRVTFEEPTHD